MGEPLETYRISHPWACGRHGEAFLITKKSSDARLLKTRGTRSTSRHAANDPLMVDQWVVLRLLLAYKHAIKKF
jgi:hypothetical protein